MRLQSLTGPSPDQSFILRAVGKLPLTFFFEAGESHVEICSVPSSPAAEHAFCGLEGSQRKPGGGAEKQPGKETMTTWSKGIVMKTERSGWIQEMARG